jgi:hypothetical protein
MGASLTPNTAQRLRQEHTRTDVPISGIIERALKEYFRKLDEARERLLSV